MKRGSEQLLSDIKRARNGIRKLSDEITPLVEDAFFESEYNDDWDDYYNELSNILDKLRSRIHDTESALIELYHEVRR